MTKENIFEKHFNANMLGVKMGITNINDFKRDYKSLYNVIMLSIDEALNTKVELPKQILKEKLTHLKILAVSAQRKGSGIVGLINIIDEEIRMT